MAVDIHIRGTERLQMLLSHLPANLATYVNQATFDYAKGIVVPHLRNELLTGVFSAERVKARKRIKAKRVSKFRSQVTMPPSLVGLDAMFPHYVALYRRRNIVNWANKYFGTAVVSGKSRVRQNKAGNLSGVIYVTPHPFVNRALTKSRRGLEPELRKGIRKAFRASGRKAE